MRLFVPLSVKQMDFQGELVAQVASDCAVFCVCVCVCVCLCVCVWCVRECEECVFVFLCLREMCGGECLH